MKRVTLLALVLFLAACAAPTPTATSTRALPTATPVPPTATPMPPTPTPIPPPPTPSVVMEGGKLDVVVIGDSSMWRIGPYYAALLEENLGVPVELDERTEGGLPIAVVAERLRTNKYWVAAFAEKEVIVFYGNPKESNMGDWHCTGDPLYVNDCSLATWEGYRRDVGAVIDEILALRGGKPTMIIATDLYNPLLDWWKENGVEEACTGCWETMTAVIREVAEAKGVAFVSRYDLFNGPNHDHAAQEYGYIGDSTHTSEAGSRAIADLLWQVKFGVIVR